MTDTRADGPSSDDQSKRDHLVGRVLGGKYRLDARVGSGAMGAVYRATHVSLERTVAVKVLLPELTVDPAARARFLREARAASRLEHQHSVAVLDFGADGDELAFLVMEFLDGRSLFDELERCGGKLELNHAVKIIVQVLAALGAAHDAGVVHRDLKPENIMLVARYVEDGTLAETAKVADFGIASVADARGSMVTHSGLIAGTPEYMSPEQCRGVPLDGRSDVYACGVLLYQLVTGTVPFQAEGALELLLCHLNEAPEAPSSRFAGVPPELDAVILRALQKDREHRFHHAREMRAALVAFLEESDPAARFARLSVLMPATRAPSAPPALAPAAATGSEAPDARQAITNPPAVFTVRPQTARSSRKGAWAAALVGVVALSASGVALLSRAHAGATASTPRALAAGVVTAAPSTVAAGGAPKVAADRVEAPTPFAATTVAAPSPTSGALTPIESRRRDTRTSRARAVGPIAQPVASAPTPAALANEPARDPVEASAPVTAALPVVEPPAREEALARVVREPSPERAEAPVESAPAPVTAFRGAVSAIEGAPGLGRHVFAARASTAASSLARCAFREAQSHGGASDSLALRVVLTVRDRRLDDVVLRDGPGWAGACAGAVRDAFAGDLPAGDDTEYTATVRVALAPVR